MCAALCFVLPALSFDGPMFWKAKNSGNNWELVEIKSFFSSAYASALSYITSLPCQLISPPASPIHPFTSPASLSTSLFSNFIIRPIIFPLFCFTSSPSCPLSLCPPMLLALRTSLAKMTLKIGALILLDFLSNSNEFAFWRKIFKGSTYTNLKIRSAGRPFDFSVKWAFQEKGIWGIDRGSGVGAGSAIRNRHFSK